MALLSIPLSAPKLISTRVRVSNACNISFVIRYLKKISVTQTLCKKHTEEHSKMDKPLGREIVLIV